VILSHGKGPFAELGEDIFDDYWMYYLTRDMAKAVDLKGAPYKNLKEYKEYKKMNLPAAETAGYPKISPPLT